MSYPVDSLEPKVAWKYFDKIRQIPHGSKNENQLGEAVMSWAREKGCETKMDRVGNVLIKVPATPGYENAPTLVLQGHLDMVCEKNADKDFDFENDPVSLIRDGDWITADGTTLGADNGIGLAVGLAFLDMPEAVHGPLELLFTVDEETGLVGARSLEPGFVTGRLLFNLDSEEDGIFYVGCAGGRDSHLELPLKRVPAPTGQTCYRVQVRGLRGGHSGLDIIKNRGNAIRLLSRTLLALDEKVDLTLASITGGDKHNAIPREAEAVIFVDSAQKGAMQEIIAAQLENFREEYASGEPELSLSAEPTDPASGGLDDGSKKAVLRLIASLPHGVLAMSRDMPGVVETSNNMARVRVEDDKLTVLNSSRSSVASALDGVVAQIVSITELAGGRADVDEGYPGWQPNMDSKMLAKAKEIWKEIHGEAAKFEAIHAGLECGIIGEKYPGMDMISLGPTIENPHSPDERISIPTVVRFFDFTKVFVASLAKG